MSFSAKKMIELGVKIADAKVFQQDKTWSKFSHDKVDIGERLVRTIRVLHKEFPLARPLTALSIGSSNEPQFRILEPVFRGGLYLLDIEAGALNIVNERIGRQSLDHVKTIVGDYNKIFSDSKKTDLFLSKSLKGNKINLIAMHHSLYYCSQQNWRVLFDNLYAKILAGQGAMHTVMMTCEDNDPYSTSWLYGHFAAKFFGCHNDQDITQFKKELAADSLFKSTQVLLKRSRVEFFTDNFEEFMSVVWMIMLYPGVHKYSYKQKEEITELVYKRFWRLKRPMVQHQDHLVVFRGIKTRGIL